MRNPTQDFLNFEKILFTEVERVQDEVEISQKARRKLFRKKWQHRFQSNGISG